MKKNILFAFAATMFSFIIIESCSKPEVIKTAKESETPILPSSPFQYQTVNTPYGTVYVAGRGNAAINNNEATLGRVLFYDKKLSLNNTVSCGSCHKQEYGFADNLAFSKGLNLTNTRFNTPPIVNVNQQNAFFWNARLRGTAEEMVLMPVSNHVEMGITNLDDLTQKLASQTYYPELFKKAFGSDEITKDKISMAIGTFMRSIQNISSRYDEGLMNNFKNFTQNEKAGKILFEQKYQCSNCHHPQTSFSYSQMEDIGLENQCNLVKMPSLRNIALTAPYMHDGRFKTLNQVFDHYSGGIKQNPCLSQNLMKGDSSNAGLRDFSFSDRERIELISFLNTLTDTYVTTADKYSNPFVIK